MTGYRGNFDDVRELFRRALDVAPEQRASFLRTATTDDDLREEVLSILAHHGDPGGDPDFFTEPWVAGRVVLDHARSALAEASRALDGDGARPTIPGFEILDELGRGSAGVVYRTEQRNPRRVVALKVFDHVLSDGLLRLRFDQEMNVLARLDHRGIPRVFDAGITEEGSPWFAMEHVDGLSLQSYVDEHQLDRKARVELVKALCEVVEFAHRNSVIHRDLKPDNILVDHAGQAWVLDFGIARVLDVSSTETPELRTEAGQILGTLHYMSPEQADGLPDCIDARTDVYALGVLLYELLTGELPCETREKNLPEALAAIREQRPPPLPDADAGLQTVLDVALAKERESRYATASDLAEDLGRWLTARPVLARAPGRVQRLRSFSQRHRAFSAGVAIAAVLLVIAFMLSFEGWRRARTSQRQAARQHGELLALSDELRLQDLLDEADDLWPPTPALAGPLEAWVDRATALRAVGVAHRDILEALETRVRAASLAPEDVDSDTDLLAMRWQAQILRDLLTALDALDAPDGQLPSVRRRHRFATSVRQRTIDDVAALWDEAATAVRSSPRYGGLELAPQLGLVPLGPDPRSGLWEFAHVEWTGDVPERDPRTGDLRITDETSLVLVLLPGGETIRGAQSSQSTGIHFDELARHNEQPLHRVWLAPFFISKYEMTRGQWRHLTGESPGRTKWMALGPQVQVTWLQSSEAMRRLGLALPTEVQWEYAARAGTEAPWPRGDDPAVLSESVNVADLSRAKKSGLPGEPTPRIDDSQPGLDIVTHRRPNPFGLHGMLGNVREPCRDVYRASYDSTPRPGDGLMVSEPDHLRTARGGSFAKRLEESRVSYRTDIREDRASGELGLRPVRAVEGLNDDS